MAHDDLMNNLGNLNRDEYQSRPGKRLRW